jgi:transcription-repair coupling factor (superfamily II helicase)
MDEVARRLREIVPGIRMAHAHGRMGAHELEEVMMDFVERRVDLLVATKIIESGLDIPNVNTIIVNRADRFGMAELYQLRGRVGRSNVQAHALLLTPPLSVLPQQTIRRLRALEEFTELGSGFNLAMRDLEIRGAGNLLGAEQSGFIESLGFETYTRILDEAVQELKEEEFHDLMKETRRASARETVVEPEFDAYIPEAYVGTDAERLAIYRRLYGLTTGAQLEEAAAELRDRFGAFPPEVENLFGIVRLRLQALKSGFPKLTIGPAKMSVDFPPETETGFYEGEEFQEIIRVISRMKEHGVVLRERDARLTLHVDLSRYAPGRDPIDAGLALLKELTREPAPSPPPSTR